MRPRSRGLLDREVPAVIGYNGGTTGGESLVSNPNPTSRRAMLVGAAVAVLANNARAQPSDDPAQILAIMERYAAGLRWGTADALVALYTSDGVFIRDNLPAHVDVSVEVRRGRRKRSSGNDGSVPDEVDDPADAIGVEEPDQRLDES